MILPVLKFDLRIANLKRLATAVNRLYLNMHAQLNDIARKGYKNQTTKPWMTGAL